MVARLPSSRPASASANAPAQTLATRPPRSWCATIRSSTSGGRARVTGTLPTRHPATTTRSSGPSSGHVSSTSRRRPTAHGVTCPGVAEPVRAAELVGGGEDLGRAREVEQVQPGGTTNRTVPLRVVTIRSCCHRAPEPSDSRALTARLACIQGATRGGAVARTCAIVTISAKRPCSALAVRSWTSPPNRRWSRRSVGGVGCGGVEHEPHRVAQVARHPRGGLAALLRADAGDDDVGHAAAGEHLREVGRREGVVAGLVQHRFVAHRLQPGGDGHGRGPVEHGAVTRRGVQHPHAWSPWSRACSTRPAMRSAMSGWRRPPSSPAAGRTPERR